MKRLAQLIVTVLCIALVSLSTSISANAAPTTPTIITPTTEQQAEAEANLAAHIAEDPADFHTRMSILDDAPAIDAYLGNFEFDIEQQKMYLAALMPTEALRGFVDMTNQGMLTLTVTQSESGEKITTIQVEDQPTTIAPKAGNASINAFPACPSAWAAFYAWYATNAAFCGAMGFFGPAAAIGCGLAMGLAGTALDFNRGC